jgi:hypothetical protein
MYDAHYLRPRSVSYCENTLNDHCRRIITIKRKLVVDSILGNTKKTEIKAVEDICSMRCENVDLDSVGGKVSEY